MCNNTDSLPTLQFVGGETQDISFDVYSGDITQPSSVSKAVFSIISSTNKFGNRTFSKNMSVTGSNKISLKLASTDTINLSGKFIYQIAIKDTAGSIEIQRGVLYIENNIDKDGTSKL